MTNSGVCGPHRGRLALGAFQRRTRERNTGDKRAGPVHESPLGSKATTPSVSRGKQKTAAPVRGRAVSGPWYHPTSQPRTGRLPLSPAARGRRHWGDPVTGVFPPPPTTPSGGSGRSSEVFFAGVPGPALQLPRFSGPFPPGTHPRQGFILQLCPLRYQRGSVVSIPRCLPYPARPAASNSSCVASRSASPTASSSRASARKSRPRVAEARVTSASMTGVSTPRRSPNSDQGTSP